MLAKSRLAQALKEFPAGAIDVVQVVGDVTLIATVVSASFSGQHEADRQAAVWSHLHSSLPDNDLRSIEFVLTNTPDEHASSNSA